MSENLGNPFISYNSTGEVRTLVGNWQEEQVLKHVTGTSRSKTVARQHEAVHGHQMDATVLAVRQDESIHEPTHSRVIQHTEHLLPSEWLTHNTVNFQPPAARNLDMASYPKTKPHGPREEQELSQLLQQAATEAPEELAPPSFETTNRAMFQAHNLHGLKVGAPAMETQDGAAVAQAPTSLAATALMPKAAADTLLTGHSSSGDVSSCCSSATVSSWIGNPSVPITLYTEAAAKSMYAGQFYGTTVINTTSPMNRNDNFTKVVGDFNKQMDYQ